MAQEITMTKRVGILAAAVVGAFLALGAGTAQAHDNCYEKIRREEFKLQKEIRRHGVWSRQAQHRRERLRELQWECRDNSRWGNRWRR